MYTGCLDSCEAIISIEFLRDGFEELKNSECLTHADFFWEMEYFNLLPVQVCIFLTCYDLLSSSSS